jgi:hypothetical protein
MVIPKSKSISGILLMVVCCLAIAFYGTARAADDGARAYWKTLENTNMVSFQYLQYNVDAAGSQQFDPSVGIYPNSETDLDIFMMGYMRQIGLFGRSATIMGAIYGGDMNAESGLDPFNPASPRIRQTATGFGDPSVGLTVNLYGAPVISNFYDMANYEPKVTVDVSGLLTIPIGEYDDDSTVNMGQNRWWGRIAFPAVFYFGSYAPLYRTSFEVTPSVFVFGENDEFLGQDLENDPLYQIEAHFTRDFTRTFFGSIDYVWRQGFDSEINGSDVGDDLELQTLGFTLDFTLNDSTGIRFSYHSNFLDDDDLDADMMRIQLYYGWNVLMENTKALQHH